MKRLVTFCLAAAVALAGCSTAKPGDVYRNTPEPGSYLPPSENPVTLRIGQLSSVEHLPLWISDQRNYFTEEGVEVELVHFHSAADRDAALGEGQIDGLLTDMINAVALYAAGHPVQIAALSLGAVPEEGPTAIVVPPDSSVQKPEDLKGTEIAIASNTILHFAAEKLLEENGFSADDMAFVAVPQPIERLSGLFTGTHEAAVLSEPELTHALALGAKLILTDTRASQNYSQSVLLLHKDTIAEKGEALKRFVRGYNKGAAMTHLSPAGFTDVLLEMGSLREDLKDVYVHGPMPLLSEVPKQADVERVVEWLFAKQLIKFKPTYEQLVNTAVLP